MLFIDAANLLIPATVMAVFRELDPNPPLPHHPLPDESELPTDSERFSVEDWVESIMKRCIDRTGRNEAVYRRMHDLRVADLTPYQGRFTGHHYAIVEIVSTEKLYHFEAPRIYLRIERGGPLQIPFGTLLAALWAAAGGSCFAGVDTIRRVDGHPYIDSAVGTVWWQGYANRPTLLDLVRVASFLRKECRTDRSESATCGSFVRDLCVLLCACGSDNYFTPFTAGGRPDFTVFRKVDDGASELYARFSEYEKDENATMVWGKHVKESAEVVGLDNEVQQSSSEVTKFEPAPANRFSALVDRIAALIDRFGALTGRIGGLVGRVGALEARVGALEARVGILETYMLDDQRDSLNGPRAGMEHPVGLHQNP